MEDQLTPILIMESISSCIDAIHSLELDEDNASW